jgi:hypothetical protein
MRIGRPGCDPGSRKPIDTTEVVITTTTYQGKRKDKQGKSFFQKKKRRAAYIYGARGAWQAESTTSPSLLPSLGDPLL